MISRNLNFPFEVVVVKPQDSSNDLKTWRFIKHRQHSCKEMHACSPGGCSRSAIVAERTCRCFLHVQDQESRMCSGSVQLLRGHARLSSDSESVKVTTAEAPDPSRGCLKLGDNI